MEFDFELNLYIDVRFRATGHNSRQWIPESLCFCALSVQATSTSILTSTPPPPTTTQSARSTCKQAHRKHSPAALQPYSMLQQAQPNSLVARTAAQDTLPYVDNRASTHGNARRSNGRSDRSRKSGSPVRISTRYHFISTS